MKGLQERAHVYKACITARLLGLFLQVNFGLCAGKFADNTSNKNKKRVSPEF